jgi:Ribbon-helix-helix protein, copG family
MTDEPNEYRTRTGRVLSDSDIDELAHEIERRAPDLEALKARRRGRPSLGSGPADVVPVRLDPELKAAVEGRAAREHTSTSEIIRKALRNYLDVA